MATVDEPLLSSPSRANPACKAILLTLSFTSVMSLAVIAGLHLTSNAHLHVCVHSRSPASCLSIISTELYDAGCLKLSRVQLLENLVKKSAAGAGRAGVAARLASLRINDQRQKSALSDCAELMDLSRDRLDESFSALHSLSRESHANVHTWLSAVLTNHVTCMDGLDRMVVSAIKADTEKLVALASTSLAVIAFAAPCGGEDVYKSLNGEYPSWLTSKDRRLLQAGANAIQANVVVAKDGSGKYTTVQEAVTAAPSNSQSRFVIYVKKGVYKEKVDIGKDKKNIMLVGDGMDATTITGSLNYVDGTTTFNSATVAAVGDGFIAQDIGFQNTAGPQKHQAVALRVGADKSVINRCKIDAYQDTLFAHSLRQFYRDTTVVGTVDFIFGDAAVVFQNCKLIARKPMAGQGNMVTAQGRTDPNQNTGTSIQNCQVIPSDDLTPVKGSIKTYLGRPWKEYSRTVYMQSSIADHIDPKGWAEWSGDFALKTLYYGEYSNQGPGARTRNRVNWPGYHVITNVNEANKFTVASLIQGGDWLKSTGVSYTEGL